MTTEAQKKAVLKYDAKNTIQIHLKLNKTKDADLIEYLKASGNVQGTIKAAMEEYMKKDRQKPNEQCEFLELCIESYGDEIDRTKCDCEKCDHYNNFEDGKYISLNDSWDA